MSVRLLAQQVGRREVSIFQRPGPEVLHEHVGGKDEAADQRLSLRRAQIGGNGALVASDDLPPELRIAPAPFAHGIADAGRLHLDDVGTRSPRSWPQNGPAINCPSSTTRMSFNAPRLTGKSISLSSLARPSPRSPSATGGMPHQKRNDTSTP